MSSAYNFLRRSFRKPKPTSKLNKSNTSINSRRLSTNHTRSNITSALIGDPVNEIALEQFVNLKGVNNNESPNHKQTNEINLFSGSPNHELITNLADLPNPIIPIDPQTNGVVGIHALNNAEEKRLADLKNKRAKSVRNNIQKKENRQLREKVKLRLNHTKKNIKKKQLELKQKRLNKIKLEEQAQIKLEEQAQIKLKEQAQIKKSRNAFKAKQLEAQKLAQNRTPIGLSL